MRRIHVTGNAGTGKSTVAASLAEILNLDFVGLDSVVWRSAWKKAPRDERLQKELELISRPTWVIDGVSEHVRKAADTIVFLDYPRHVSFVRCAKRNWRYLFRSRPGLPERCPEILIIPRLVKIIWRFPNLVRPKILEEFDAYRGTKKLIHIQNDAELQAFLESVKKISEGN